jgi:hypothetical protein
LVDLVNRSGVNKKLTSGGKEYREKVIARCNDALWVSFSDAKTTVSDYTPEKILESLKFSDTASASRQQAVAQAKNFNVAAIAEKFSGSETSFALQGAQSDSAAEFPLTPSIAGKIIGIGVLLVVFGIVVGISPFAFAGLSMMIVGVFTAITGVIALIIAA